MLCLFLKQKGNHVVFGINGDAYDTSNGVSNGLVINDCVLITSSNATYGWGMLEDGTVKHGSAKLNMTATIAGGKSLTLKHVNKERKLDTSGIYLLTEDDIKLFNLPEDWLYDVYVNNGIITIATTGNIKLNIEELKILVTVNIIDDNMSLNIIEVTNM
ncbi:MAG TPA: phosphodiester glycosidase family protein [Acholeplasmataceae bacterium]|nr:phosphodiester glycosidase family protein [Acholeplasmataceae bacterium]